MKYFLFVFCLFNFFSSSAQNPLEKQWDKRYGGVDNDELKTFLQTYDEGYIFGGTTQSDSSGDVSEPTRGGLDFWCIKIDSFGNKQWDKRFGGTSNEFLSAICLLTGGEYILGGFSASGVSGDVSQSGLGALDYWVIKIDSAGNKEWDKRFGGDGWDQLYSLQQTNDGGYILGGYTNSDSGTGISQHAHGGQDYWMVKTDSLGNKIWDKRFGGSNDEQLFSIQQTRDAGYVLGGLTGSDIGGDISEASKGGYDFWVVKTDSFGNKLWDKRFGGSGDDLSYSLQQTNDGGYILGGFTLSDSSGDVSQITRGDADYWIIKIDSVGNKQWDKRFGGTGKEDDFGYIQQTADGGYLLSGSSYSNISGDKTENNLGPEQTWIVKLDSWGNKQWDKTIFTVGHDEYGYAIKDDNRCYAIANYTRADTGGYLTQSKRGGDDFWLVKFCDTTTCNNVVSISVNGNILSAYNAVYYQWLFNGSPISGATSDFYLANQVGSYSVAVTYANGCQALSNAILISDIKNLSETQLSISPNPFTENISITLQKENLQQATFNITNIIGQPVYTKHESNLSSTYTKMLDLSYLPNGVYFLEVIADGERSVKELVKQ